MLSGPPLTFEFGPFRVNAAERTLLRDGAQVALTDKVFELLLLLVRNRGHALTKPELMQQLWPDTVVEENNLTVNISTLRKALGETASERRYIETLSRRGYRFVADAREARAELGLESIAKGRPTFVGREAELGQLLDLLGRARGGQGRVVFIDGEPGMGKTELAEQFLGLAHAQGRLFIAQGRCLEQYGTGEAYLPFLEACRALLLGPDHDRIAPLVRQHAATWFAQFGGPSGSSDSGQLRQEVRGASSASMLREMGDALEALSRLEPVVLLLEDMHWADPSSSDLLRLLAQRAASRRLLIVATLRGSEVELENHPMKNLRRELLAHDQCDQLVLPLLDQAAIASYIDARFQPHELGPELSALIVKTTEGHPLFATRLVQMLVERGDIQQLEGRWRSTRPVAELEPSVPNGVRGLIQRKLDSLTEQDLRALQYASVIGVDFSSSALAELLERDELDVDDQLDALARAHHLLEPLGDEGLPNGQLVVRYRFAHVLYRNVLYDALAGKRRMLLHQRAAEHLSAALGADDWRVAAQLALHFEAARQYGRAIHYLKRAADNAGRLHAHREAEQHYARALRLLEQLPAAEQIPENIILHYSHGWCAANLDDPTRAVRDFETMLFAARSPEFAGDTPEAKRARDVVFDYLEEPWRDAFGLFDTPRMANQDRSMGHAAIQCEAYWALCFVLVRNGRIDEADLRAREYLALADASHNEPRRVEALGRVGWIELVRGNLGAAKRCVDAGLPAARAIPHPRAMYVFFAIGGRVLQLRGEYELAEAMNLEALPMSMEAAGRIDCLLGIALARAHLGRVSAALEPLGEALDIARRTDVSDRALKVTAALGWLHREIGDWEGAMQHLTSAVDLARHRSTGVKKRFRLELARAHVALGDTASALDQLAHADRLDPNPDTGDGAYPTAAARRVWLHPCAARAEYHIERGEHAAAKPAAELLLQHATALGSPKHTALGHLLCARLALAARDLTSARVQANRGIDQVLAHPLPLVGWRLYELLGTACRQAGDAAAGSLAFSRALALVEQIEAGLKDAHLLAIWSSSRDVRALRAAAASPAPAHAVR